MIQTHYVRLEPPYEVIFCNGEVGIQIGSLIAVEEKRGENNEYGLVTHTHPIVSYGSKKTLSFWTNSESEVWTSPGDYVQGAVWDKVEAKDVLVVGVLDEEKGWHISEKGFADLLNRTYEARIQQGQSLKNVLYNLYRSLRLIGIEPIYKQYEEVKLFVDEVDYVDKQYLTMYSPGTTILLSIPWGTIDEMVREVLRQTLSYETVCFKKNVRFFERNSIPWHFESQICGVAETADKESVKKYERLTKLVERLNKLYGGVK